MKTTASANGFECVARDETDDPEGGPGGKFAFQMLLTALATPPIASSDNGTEEDNPDTQAEKQALAEGGLGDENSTEKRQIGGDPFKNRRISPGHASDQASDDETLSADLHPRDKQGRGSKKFNDNSVIAIHPTSVQNPADRRVYATYEAAGLPKHTLDHLVRVLHESAIRGKRRMGLTLQTSELGKIEFDIQIDEKRLIITATVEGSRAASALGLAIADLRDKLDACGLVLGRFDVATRSSKNTDWKYQAPEGRSNDRGRRTNRPQQGIDAPRISTGKESIFHVLA
ncbi:MAG: flagellar hook-length control protein FliK [Myxococcota bacterium]|nr:flagellar hook-length control protein FliK [Myxococcota bacterium]